MLTLDSVLERAADVRFRTVGDEGVVLRQSTAEVSGLNEVAARLFNLLGDGLILYAMPSISSHRSPSGHFL